MSTWKWIWRISLPNQSMVQHFELSEICFFTIVLMYATKGGSKFWSLVSKYISSWSIHSRGVTVNRWILHHQSSRDIPYHGGASNPNLHHQSSRDIPYHGGASNPNCSWRRFQYQSTQGWSLYGGDFNFTYSWKHIAHCKKWTWTWPNLKVSVDLTRYHMWSWMYVRCSITGDIQEMSWLSCLLQISSEIPYVLTRTLFISYMSRFQELSFADQLRDIKLSNCMQGIYQEWTVSSVYRSILMKSVEANVNKYVQLYVSILIPSWIRRRSMTHWICTRGLL